MSSDASDNQATEEEGLLVEAVTLLVRRQRETEAWIAEQLSRADERASTTEQRYGELEARLAGIEDQLSRLTRVFEPARADPVLGSRLAQLREELDGLKSEVDGRPAVPPPAEAEAEAEAEVEVAVRVESGSLSPSASVEPGVPSASARPVAASSAEPVEHEREAAPAATPHGAGAAPSRSRGARLQSVLGKRVLGRSTRERFGLLMIAAGAAAVLYALFTQLRLA